MEKLYDYDHRLLWDTRQQKNKAKLVDRSSGISKVALIGGIGKLGRGLVPRLSESHCVVIGSRDEAEGTGAAKKLQEVMGRQVTGGSNQTMAGECDLAILAVPNGENLK